MNEKFKCSLQNCVKHERCENNKQMHHYTLNDLKHEDLNYENEVLNKNLPSYFKRSLNVEELKNLYQSAYIFNLLFDFAREYLPPLRGEEPTEDEIKEKEATTDTSCDKIKEKILEFLFRNEKSFKVESNVPKTVVSEEQLWDTDEINTLRKVFASIKETNIQLNSQMIVLERENKELREKLETLRVETQNLPTEKRNLSSENERLYIRLRDLQLEFKTFNSQMDFHEKEKNMLKERLDSERKINQTLSNEKTMIEFELRKCENGLNSLTNDFKLKQTLLIDKIKLKYENRIAKLEAKINKLKEQFETEKGEHLKTQNALKHLRSHFMSECLPVSKNPVKLDDDKIKLF
jgi:hypothetical protein